MVSDRQTFMVTSDSFLNKTSNKDGNYIAKLERGVIGDILECEEDLCKVKASTLEGYVTKNTIWGCKDKSE